MNFRDLTNMNFGRLRVIGLSHFSHGGAMWICQCSCGNKKVVRGSHLTAGDIKSCGCLRKEVLNKTTHGSSYSRLYNIWASIKKRCENKNNKDFYRYGGRGIKLFSNWHQFESFRDWALTNGYNDNLTIDRIDTNKNYEPSNCRWVTAKDQAQNRRSNKFITFNGKTLCLSEWGRQLGINPNVIGQRLKRGWTIEKTLTTPTKKQKRI